MVKLYCEVCNDHVEVIAEAAQDTDFPEQGIWGDIVCTKCHFVISGFKASEEGVYELVKVSDLPDLYTLKLVPGATIRGGSVKARIVEWNGALPIEKF